MHKLHFTVEVEDDQEIEVEICQLLQQQFIGMVALLDYCANTHASSMIETDES